MSLLARKEVEVRTKERRALQAEKHRRKRLKRPGYQIDKSGSIERALALIEALSAAIERRHHLPGGRGMDGPQEDFLNLMANDLEGSGPGTDGFDKIYRGMFFHSFIFGRSF